MSAVHTPHRAHADLVAAARFTANGDAPLRLDAARAALTAALALLSDERDRLHPDADFYGDLADAAGAVSLALDAMQGAHR